MIFPLLFRTVQCILRILIQHTSTFSDLFPIGSHSGGHRTIRSQLFLKHQICSLYHRFGHILQIDGIPVSIQTVDTRRHINDFLHDLSHHFQNVIPIASSLLDIDAFQVINSQHHQISFFPFFDAIFQILQKTAYIQKSCQRIHFLSHYRIGNPAE